MKSNVIAINSNGQGFCEMLQETEKAAVYAGLSRKQSLRLRLLAEEMSGMFRTIIPHKSAEYWIETEEKHFWLHLAAETNMNPDLREELLKTATSGKNAAAVGFMGKLRDLFMQMGEFDNTGMPPMMEYGFLDGDLDTIETPDGMMNGMMFNWSLKEYRSAIEERKEENLESWDELEKSITAKLADEIKVFINYNKVEMVIDKQF